MVAIAVWSAIISLIGLVVSSALYGHRQHRNPRWAALDAQFEAQLLQQLAPAAVHKQGERRRFVTRSLNLANRRLAHARATVAPPARRSERSSIAGRRFAQRPARRSQRDRS